MGKFCWFVVVALILFGSVGSPAQEKMITPDLAQIANGKAWAVYNATVEALEVDGNRAVRLKVKGNSADETIGLALLNGFEFTTGTIELDLKGKNIKQGSFLGVAFNAADGRTFECVYFRPFNFKADEPSCNRAVQYIAWPENTWAKLRQEKPGKFEGPVNPVPDPDGWFHVRIEVEDKQVRMFVNEAKVPSLTVDRLMKGSKGRKVGLFVDVAEGLYANLKVRPAQ